MILHKISQNACRSQMERSRNVMWSSGYYSPLIWWIWHSLTEYVLNKLINTTEIACGCHLNWYLIDSLKGFLPYHEVILWDSVWQHTIFKPLESFHAIDMWVYPKLLVSQKDHLPKSKPALLMSPTLQHLPADVKAHISYIRLSLWHCIYS